MNRAIIEITLWIILILSIIAISIVVISGGIYLFSIGNFQIAVHDIRRPTFFLIISAIILLYIKRVNLIAALSNIARHCDKNIFIVIMFFTAILSWLKILQLYAFDTGIDLPIFDYAIFNTLKGNFMYTPIVGRNFLSDHFSPILILLTPIYLGPYSLMVIQSMATVFSGYFLYKLVQLSIKDNLISVLILIAYLGSESLMRGFFFDFHVEMFIPLFILGAFYFFKTKAYLAYWMFIVFAIMCKEDTAIYIFALGMYIYVFGKNRKIGYVTCLISLLWIVLVFKIIMPFLHPEKVNTSYYLTRWNSYGRSYTEVIKNMVIHPVEMLKTIFTEPSVDLFKSVLFLPIISPSTCFLIMPPLILNLTSNFQFQASLAVHYVIPIIPFLWISVISGLNKISKRNVLLCITVLVFIINFGHYRFYKIDSRIVLGHKILEMIPNNCRISTQSCFIPHLDHKKDVLIFPRVENSDYILVDLKKPFWPFEKRKDLYKEINKYINSKKWKKVISIDSYFLLNKQDICNA